MFKALNYHRAMAKARHFADVSVLLEVALYALITSGFKP